MDAIVQNREISARDGFKPQVPDFVSARLPFAREFIRFCLVGGSGVVVDMGVLFLLADPRCLGLNITFSKICAAEVAMVNNFIWNELWTFRRNAPVAGKDNSVPPFNAATSELNRRGIIRRLLLFNAICGIGIGLAVLLLHTFHRSFGLNLYLSNLLAIILVVIWNFAMNARLTWRLSKKRTH